MNSFDRKKNRIKLTPKEIEKRIVTILTPLIGDDKTTLQVARETPYNDTTVRNVLRNLKSRGYVVTDPPVCDHKGWVVWKITPKGISRVMRCKAAPESRPDIAEIEKLHREKHPAQEAV